MLKRKGKFVPSTLCSRCELNSPLVVSFSSAEPHWVHLKASLRVQGGEINTAMSELHRTPRVLIWVQSIHVWGTEGKRSHLEPEVLFGYLLKILIFFPHDRLIAKSSPDFSPLPLPTSSVVRLCSSSHEDTHCISHPVNLSWPLGFLWSMECARSKGILVLSPDLRSSCMLPFSLGSPGSLASRLRGSSPFKYTHIKKSWTTLFLDHLRSYDHA